MVFQELLHDVRYGLRTLTRDRVFTLTVVATLAVGIGANTAIFSIVNAVLLRPLQYDEPGELVMIFRTVPRFGFTRSTVSYPDYLDWIERSRSFSSMAAYRYATRNYTSQEVVERWQGFQVTGNLFSTLGVTPMHGRVVNATDDSPGGPNVIVLSHSLWQNRFNGDLAIIGSPIQLDGQPSTVIGVMPPEFDFPLRSADFWAPLQASREQSDRSSNFLGVIGRLGVGTTIAQAQTEIASVAARIDAEAPDGNHGYGIFVEGRHDYVVRNARTALLVFMGAVGFVMIVAVGNVVNLLLARGTTRRQELSVRVALGASRFRLIRQLLAESTILSVFGGACGIVVALSMIQLFLSVGPTDLPRIADVRFDLMTFVFATVLALVVGIVFGALPALLGSGSGTHKRDDVRTGIGSLTRIQHVLVVCEIAIAVALSIGAGLLMNSFARLTSVAPGFDPHNVIAARVTLPPMDMGSDAGMERVAEERQQFFGEVLSRAGGLPGVSSAALSFAMPFGGYSFTRIVRPEGLQREEGNEPVVTGQIVSGNLFQTLGIPITSGRSFLASDDAESPAVAIINQTMADAFWSGQDPIGKRFRIGDGDRSWTTVVGTVGRVTNRSLAEEPEPTYYRPFRQVAWPDGMFVVLRSTIPPEQVVPAFRREIQSMAGLPVTDVAKASELIDDSIASPRFRTVVLGVFGAIAVGLAFIGIYGVVSFTVGNRTREIGIRMALGAARSGVIRMVLRRGLILATFGVGLGLVSAVGLTRFLRTMLFELTPYDPLTYTLAAVSIVAVTLLASFGPARRAAATDPVMTLRQE